MVLEKIKTFFKSQFSEFEIQDFDPRTQWGSAWSIFGAWAIPSFLFVYCVETYRPENEYFIKAIDQAIGPNLWNVIGSFGLCLFGMAIIFSNIETIAKVTNKILFGTYSIGALTLGVLTGQWLFVANKSELIWWQVGIFDIKSAIFLVILLALNCFIWYLTFLLKTDTGNKSTPLTKLENMNLSWRVSTGLGIIVLIIYGFLTQE